MKWFSVHVGGQKWRVDLVKGNSPHFQAAEDEDVLGISYRDRCKIYIAKEQSDQAREDALLHELLHASFQVSGVNDILAEACEGRDIAAGVEERVVRVLVPVWHRLLKDLGFSFPKGPVQ